VKKRLLLAVATIATVAATLTGCATDADTVSYNLSKDADQFKIDRRVVFYNGITNEYILTIEGRCSITDAEGQLEVTCAIGPDAYKKHFLGLSDNVTYFAEQLEVADASRYHYKVLFKPEAILPEVDVESGKQ
jgi:hypothetical protein